MRRTSILHILSGLATIALLCGSSLAAAPVQKVLYSFTDGSDGAWPKGTLTMDTNGNLFGTAQYGGNTAGCMGCGTVFELTPNGDGTWNYQVIHTFNDADGAGPIGGVVFDSQGNLYGTTAFGGSYQSGNVFELSPNADGSWTETVLYTFTGGVDGNEPLTAVTLDSAGNVYGTTPMGGIYGGGVVFKLTNSNGTWTESAIYDFSGLDGSFASSKIIFDSAGNAYGTTSGGGSSGGHGVVYELSPGTGGTWTSTILHSFTGKGDGSGPDGVVFDSAGNLYGAAATGGSTKNCDYGCGTIFVMHPSNGSWQFKVIHYFRGAPATTPNGDLTFDHFGHLWGTTSGVGVGSIGNVFVITRTADLWNYAVLYTFGQGNDGTTPLGGVVTDSAGNAFGTTISNTSCYLCGVVYEITP